MENKNDERIMKLREEISERRKSLAKKPAVFHPVTNCLLTLDGVTYNLPDDGFLSRRRYK